MDTFKSAFPAIRKITNPALVNYIMNTTLKSVESLLQRAKSNLRKEIIMMYPEGKEKK